MNKYIKAITLILFATLIAAFVAYKSGFFTKEETNSKRNSQTENPTIQNQNKENSDSVEKIKMLSSSKSLIMVEPDVLVKENKKTKRDSLKK